MFESRNKAATTKHDPICVQGAAATVGQVEGRCQHAFLFPITHLFLEESANSYSTASQPTLCLHNAHPTASS